MTKSNYSLIVCALFFFSLPGRSAASSDCTTSRCHAGLLQGRIVHSPVEDGECGDCHKKKKKEHPGPEGKEFSLTEKIPALCGDCHDLPEMDYDLHPPLVKGQCTACHDPHSSPSPGLLVGRTPADACRECHQTGMEDKLWVHGPVAVGGCTVCHEGHGSLKNSLLIEEEATTICYQCHLEKKATIEGFAVIHGPVQTSCTSCHSPHESDYKFQLKDGVPSLCNSCHEGIADLVVEASTVHGALLEDRRCLNCHTPHGSTYKYNLQQETFYLCLNCHDEPLPSVGKPLTDMKELLDDNPDWHGPIRERDCSGCHNPHGSSNIRLLKLFYPPKFYAPFELDNYQLCFQCHEEKNVLEKKSTLTNFREKTRNLHFLHVNREKGRTCRACHQEHASVHPFHVRDTVPFGAWDLPVNFTPEPNGGSCTPGCHKTKTYQR